MRWTQAARATKRAARGRRSRVVLTSRRRCQAPGKLTLLRGDGDKKARSPGRARRKPLKPFAQGMPGRSGEPVVTMLVCFIYFAREATGALTHPAFPAPSVVEGILCNNPDVLRRGKAEVCFLLCRPGLEPGPITTGLRYGAKAVDRRSFNTVSALGSPPARGRQSR